ncbi:MAG: FAD-dependent oxidoreductase [Rickettsiales bacterium]
MATVHIIGGGVSGLAAATQLAEAHIPVKLYEATAHVGGRARSSTDAALGSIDHGLHIIGAESRELFAYLTRIGSVNTLKPIANPWKFHPAPIADYLDMLNAVTRPDDAVGEDIAPENQLVDGGVQSRARVLLHTPLEQLSSKAMRQLLWRKLRCKERGYYVPAESLAESFITPALNHLEYHGGCMYFSHALKGVEWADGKANSLTFARKKVPVLAEDVVILATPPSFTQAILPAITVPISNHASITVHYAVAHREALGIIAPLNAPLDIVRYDDGYIRVMIRIANAQWQSDPKLLAHRMWRWLQKQHAYLQTTRMPEYAIWREKRAGHLLTPHPRLDIAHLPPRILLAGDWLEAHAPSSLESAAANGHRAARAAIALIPKSGLRYQTPYSPYGRV